MRMMPAVHGNADILKFSESSLGVYTDLGIHLFGGQIAFVLIHDEPPKNLCLIIFDLGRTDIKICIQVYYSVFSLFWQGVLKK